jgi:sucrose-6-phosphate hydrolase SacC (GH32 family)
MKEYLVFILLASCMLLITCRSGKDTGFAGEMVEFSPYKDNPVFTGSDSGKWDEHIRERGFILYDEGKFRLWYTGYRDEGTRYLGYALSGDGIKWDRYSDKPLFDQKWTEDMFVMKNEGTYYMYAEGLNDVAHLLTSADGISWQEQGDLIMISSRGDTIPGPYGTPSVIIEDGKWYLFYERNDNGIWVAGTTDKRTWINISDEPVLKKGPGKYDSGAVAANQVIKYKGKYYMYYHGSSDPDWDKPGAASIWTSNVAVSADLIHWEKYPGNPIVEGDHSSPIMVVADSEYRLYTMHPDVRLYLPR